MRILVFNWRDIKNPSAGGAEEFIHQIFSRIALKGNEVTLVTSKVPNLTKEEKIDGIRIVRSGGKFMTYLLSFFFYLRYKNNYDVIVESINTIPYLTPFYAKGKNMAILHHVGGRETYDLEVNPMMSSILTFLQKLTLLIYRSQKVVAVSPSTKAELVRSKLSDRNVALILNGVNIESSTEKFSKYVYPTIVYFGRVKPLKRVEEVIFAFQEVKGRVPDARLIIAGRGDKTYYDRLNKLAYSSRVKDIAFIGEIKEEDKPSQIGRCWIFVTASVKEGWGISVLEANKFGLPAVAYDVPGLRDSIKNGVTGYLVKNGDRDKLVEALVRLLTDDDLRIKMSESATRWAKSFDWNVSAERMLKEIGELHG
jgi:glycosyltransferase involved in cell wall biosynthesis